MQRFTRYELWHDRIPTALICALAGASSLGAIITRELDHGLFPIATIAFAIFCVIRK